MIEISTFIFNSNESENDVCVCVCVYECVYMCVLNTIADVIEVFSAVVRYVENTTNAILTFIAENETV